MRYTSQRGRGAEWTAYLQPPESIAHTFCDQIINQALLKMSRLNHCQFSGVIADVRAVKRCPVMIPTS